MHIVHAIPCLVYVHAVHTKSCTVQNYSVFGLRTHRDHAVVHIQF